MGSLITTQAYPIDPSWYEDEVFQRMVVQVLSDTWSVCWRELVYFRRSRSSMFSTLIQPIAWLAFMGNIFQLPADIMGRFFGASTYLQFFTPTVLVLVAVLGGILGGYSIIIDVQKVYFYKMLVAPIDRSAIASGKTLSFGLKVGVQAVIICGIASAMGVSIVTGVVGIIAVILVAMLLCLAFGGLSLAVAVSAKNIDAHQAFLNMLALPLIFPSPSISSFESMPSWFATLARFNPVTYAIESIRTIMISGWNFGIILPDLLVVGAFSIAMLLIATILFRKWRI
jgi:ABC-2 type transport system permease protein